MVYEETGFKNYRSEKPKISVMIIFIVLKLTFIPCKRYQKYQKNKGTIIFTREQVEFYFNFSFFEIGTESKESHRAAFYMF